MARNKMHSFAINPEVHISRSRFDMPCNIKFTGNAADLIPFYCVEVLPGDTFDVSTSLVCRLQTLLHPLMDNLYLDTYYFFCPSRLVYDRWQAFCGEPDKAWMPTKEYRIPKIEFKPMGMQEPDEFASEFKDTVLDYMGVGYAWNGIYLQGDKLEVNALPVRCYNKIYDAWFRDENLQDPINIYTGEGSVEYDYRDPRFGGKCYKVAKLHDYFTSALPGPQRGDPVTLASGIGAGFAPVFAGDPHEVGRGSAMSFQGTGSAGLTYQLSNNVVSGTRVWTTANPGDPTFTPNNLYANIENLNLGITINDLRLAFQIQKFMEKSARGGARYVEFLKAQFGVTSPDARLQRPEYLGGHRKAISIHQVVNQTESMDAPLGNVGAVSLTTDVHNDFIHSFVEHGYVIGLCCVRYKHSYSQGMHRMWTRDSLFDFYLPVFANLGEQAVDQRELYANLSNEEVPVTFGYQERWAEYRYLPDRVAGEFRPGIPNTLASWHLGDYYTQAPTLSSEWIQEDKTNIDRALSVTSAVADQFLFDILVKNRATRPMPTYSIPGLVDHH